MQDEAVSRFVLYMSKIAQLSRVMMSLKPSLPLVYCQLDYEYVLWLATHTAHAGIAAIPVEWLSEKKLWILTFKIAALSLRPF